MINSINNTNNSKQKRILAAIEHAAETLEGLVELDTEELDKKLKKLVKIHGVYVDNNQSVRGDAIQVQQISCILTTNIILNYFDDKEVTKAEILEVFRSIRSDDFYFENEQDLWYYPQDLYYYIR